ncbi:MAG: adenosylcobalamin-dependent ribonucleoside-diphosphate reductase, partial [Dehalococcoidia bacterium]
MGTAKIDQIHKRDGSTVAFDPGKIKQAIEKALTATGVEDTSVADGLTRTVVNNMENTFTQGIPTVEDVQDAVEKALMSQGYSDVAKAYILYRQQRASVRRLKKSIGAQDDMKLSINAIRVLERRYLLKDENGQIVETPTALFRRVAHAIASMETRFDQNANVRKLEDEFFNLMYNLEFLPNSPTLMNAGTSMGQLSACFVLPVEDSIMDIFGALRNAAVIHQSGGGTGFSFSRIRPQGDVVRSTRGIASGPVSFMKVFDMATGVMKQGGRRRGANMGILRADHPDIREFVLSKSDENSFANFNLSVGATDEFMNAASQGGSWPLTNPRTGKEMRSVRAQDLFDLIVNNAWRTGDPGLIFLDEINRYNATPHLGSIEATNPCGELPLLPYESCNLGSINLSRMVSYGDFDWARMKQVIRLAVHFLDNVIEANAFPLSEIEETTRGNRKIGLGVMGFADALAQLGIPYDSEEGLEMADRLMGFISSEARKASAELGSSRGAFPNFQGSVHDRPDSPPLRNASFTSIAPTGSISILADCSSGIEPLFALAFVRNVMDNTRLTEAHPIFAEIMQERNLYSESLERQVAEQGCLRGVEGIPSDLERLFVTAHDVTPEWHIRMQATFQEHTDNAVSKTVNFPSAATPDDVEQVY